MKNDFRKRIYNNLSDFLSDLLSFIINSSIYVRNIKNKGISRKLREKLMVAVSGVLGCKYCTWLHSEMALSHGVDAGDIQRLLSSELGDFPEEEAVALAFAQHYSETGGKIQKQVRQRLHKYYGRETARDISGYIQIIYFGNLAGNTVDALLERLKGHPVEGSNSWDEVVIFLLSSPYFFGILPLIAHTAGYINRRGKKLAE
ncbi:MAG: carboxymuconolactone decarboxylase family protein [Syntrophobacterales bacterium]|nr:carboxymuconolactone decarboxylase family protein [Syntrophobacterales bacterium]